MTCSVEVFFYLTLLPRSGDKHPAHLHQWHFPFLVNQTTTLFSLSQLGFREARMTSMDSTGNSDASTTDYFLFDTNEFMASPRHIVLPLFSFIVDRFHKVCVPCCGRSCPGSATNSLDAFPRCEPLVLAPGGPQISTGDQSIFVRLTPSHTSTQLVPQLFSRHFYPIGQWTATQQRLGESYCQLLHMIGTHRIIAAEFAD